MFGVLFCICSPHRYDQTSNETLHAIYLAARLTSVNTCRANQHEEKNPCTFAHTKTKKYDKKLHTRSDGEETQRLRFCFSVVHSPSGAQMFSLHRILLRFDLNWDTVRMLFGGYFDVCQSLPLCQTKSMVRWFNVKTIDVAHVFAKTVLAEMPEIRLNECKGNECLEHNFCILYLFSYFLPLKYSILIAYCLLHRVHHIDFDFFFTVLFICESNIVFSLKLHLTNKKK